MEIQKICIKFYANGGQNVDQSVLIPVFQDWIKEKKLDEVMIDIADYRHVPNGPGMMLICHETDYALDGAENNQLGLLAQRKEKQEGDHQTRTLGVVKSVLSFIKLLKQDARIPKELTFDYSGFEYIANDRLRVENSDAGFASVQDDIEAVGKKLYGEVKIERRKNHPKARLAVSVRGRETDLETLLQNAA